MNDGDDVLNVPYGVRAIQGMQAVLKTTTICVGQEGGVHVGIQEALFQASIPTSDMSDGHVSINILEGTLCIPYEGLIALNDSENTGHDGKRGSNGDAVGNIGYKKATMSLDIDGLDKIIEDKVAIKNIKVPLLLFDVIRVQDSLNKDSEVVCAVEVVGVCGTCRTILQETISNLIRVDVLSKARTEAEDIGINDNIWTVGISLRIKAGGI